MNKYMSSVAVAALTAFAVGGASLPALAEDGFTGKSAGDFLVRARAILVAPDESATITTIGGDTAIDNTVVPEVDFSYFLTDHVAFELIAAVTPHNVKAIGTAIGDVDLGDVWLLPPTITMQYHFMPKERFSPYVGAGLNFTAFFNSDHPAGTVTGIDYDPSFGFAAQAGFDYFVDDNLFINVDVKKVFINTDVTIDTVLGRVNADVDIDPWIVGVGVGYKF